MWQGFAPRGARGRFEAAAIALSFVALSLSPDAARAQAKYPDKPVRVIVPFAAGGATDIIARLLTQGLTETFGQSVVIENRPGAGSNLGANAVARSDADGYTLLIASSAIIASPALYRNLSYDIFKDLTPVAELVGSTNIIIAGPKAGIDSIADMVRAAKANPDKLNYASPGTGTTPQLAMELLKLRAGINVTHVVFGGAAPAMQAILAQTVELGSMALSNIHGQVKAGTVKPLAVTGTERWHDLPDIPTVEQSGYANFDFETVFILMAPGGTPPEIIDKVSRETIAILNRPDVRDRMQNAGFAVLARGPEALKARIAKEVPVYKDIVAKAGIPVN
jgi:tripartite-type tricarboxylate transporter receptor subunit TctC